MTEEAPLLLDPFPEATLRREALQWAVASVRVGESQEHVLARAQAYFDFITKPLRRDVITALQERAQHSLQ